MRLPLPAFVRRHARATLRRFGLDVVRFRPDVHALARRARLLAEHRVDVVLDVGANEGQYALELRQLGYRGRITSFEPLARPFAVLYERARADPEASWRAIHAALGERDGTTTIHVAGNSYSSSILPMLDRHVASAPASRFVGDEVVRVLDARRALLEHAQGRPFLKLDVQGFEATILRAAGDALDRFVGVQLEMSLVPLYEGEVLLRGLLDLLEQRRFQLMALEPGFADAATGQLLQVDGVFFR